MNFSQLRRLTYAIFFFALLFSFFLLLVSCEKKYDENGLAIIKISSWEDLQNIQDLHAHYILTKNLLYDTEDASNNNFLPISLSNNKLNDIYYGKSFTGIFDGNNKTISNLQISLSNNYVGLFASIGKFAVIKNLTLKNARIKGNNFVGAIAGQVVDDALLQNISCIDCTVNSLKSDGKNIGGITGLNDAQIFAAYEGNITGYENIGGIAGTNLGGIYAQVLTEITGTNNVGGIAGENFGAIIASVGIPFDTYGTKAIEKILAKKEPLAVLQGSNQVGGISGINYEGASITALTNQLINGTTLVGGISGTNSGNIIAFVQGSITGKEQVAGIAGKSTQGNITAIISSNIFGDNDISAITSFHSEGNIIAYWDIETSGFNKDKILSEHNIYKDLSVQNPDNTLVVGISAIDNIIRDGKVNLDTKRSNQEVFTHPTFLNFFELSEKNASWPKFKHVDFSIKSGY